MDDKTLLIKGARGLGPECTYIESKMKARTYAASKIGARIRFAQSMVWLSFELTVWFILFFPLILIANPKVFKFMLSITKSGMVVQPCHWV